MCSSDLAALRKARGDLRRLRSVKESGQKAFKYALIRTSSHPDGRAVIGHIEINGTADDVAIELADRIQREFTQLAVPNQKASGYEGLDYIRPGTFIRAFEKENPGFTIVRESLAVDEPRYHVWVRYKNGNEEIVDSDDSRGVAERSANHLFRQFADDVDAEESAVWVEDTETGEAILKHG